MSKLKRFFLILFLASLLTWPILGFCQDPGEPDTARVECLQFVRPNSQVVLNVYVTNDSALGGVTIPLTFPDTTTQLDITCDSISFVGTRAASAGYLSDSTSINNEQNRIVVFALWLTGNLTPGNGSVAKIYFTTGPEWDSTQYVKVDTLFWPTEEPGIVNTLEFTNTVGGAFLPAFVEGCIGTGQLPTRDDTLTYTAYSPVDLIVTDPNGDSIGVNFNTIPDASYDTTRDVNSDGDKDDQVIIPKPITDEYTVKVVGEPGSSGGNYTLAVKLNGNEETPLLNSVLAPGPGEVDTVFYTVTEYLRGDPNRDGSPSISDVIFLINYLFKGGEAPEPLFLGDVNCDETVSVADVIYMVNYLFKGGNAPCS